MAKMTAKYKAAHALGATLLGKSQVDQVPAPKLYEELQHAGYQWQSDSQTWIKLEDFDADPASPLMRLRVWAPKDVVELEANQLEIFLHSVGYKTVDHSMPYPCRPPKQLESRVYLTMQRP